MTFPAWRAFYRDPVIRRNHAAAQVYAALLGLGDMIMYEPRAVKAWVLAEAEGLKKETVLRALNLLVARGYVIEHARAPNNVRRFTIATNVSEPDTSSPKRTEPSAA